MADNHGKWFLTKVKKACQRFQMIEEGDRIAVGISGGKDSSALLYIFSLLGRHLPFKFEIIPIYVDLGFGMNLAPLEEFCQGVGYQLEVEKTQIKEIVFDIRKESNPCSLCSKMRKGALIRKAKQLNCNKLALGHHLDDAMETFFMNMIYTGKLGAFAPKLYLDRMDITMIRPMVYLTESTIVSVVQSKGLPIVKNVCPADGITKREEMKEFVAGIVEKYPDFKKKFLNSMSNVDWHGIWLTEEEKKDIL